MPTPTPATTATAAAARPAADHDEEEDKALTETAAAPAPAGPAAPETIKAKHVEKAKKALRREEEERASAAAAARAAEEKPLADPIAEKLRLAALQVRQGDRQHAIATAASVYHVAASRPPRCCCRPQEKADLELAREYLSVTPVAGNNASLIASLTMTDAEGFKTVGGLVAKRINDASGAKSAANAMAFYKELLRAACDRLSIDEIKELTMVLDVGRQRKVQVSGVVWCGVGWLPPSSAACRWCDTCDSACASAGARTRATGRRGRASTSAAAAAASRR